MSLFLRISALAAALATASCSNAPKPSPTTTGASFEFDAGKTYIVAHAPGPVARGFLGDAAFCPKDSSGHATLTRSVLTTPVCSVDGRIEGPLGPINKLSLSFEHVSLGDGSALYVAEVRRLLNVPIAPGRYALLYQSFSGRPGRRIERDHAILDVVPGQIHNAGRLTDCGAPVGRGWPLCASLRPIGSDEFAQRMQSAAPNVDPDRLRGSALKVADLDCGADDGAEWRCRVP